MAVEDRLKQIIDALPTGAKRIARSESIVFRIGDKAVKVYEVFEPPVVELYARTTNLLAYYFNGNGVEITSRNGRIIIVQLEIVKVDRTLNVAGYPATESKFIPGPNLEEEFKAIPERDQMGQIYKQNMYHVLSTQSREISQSFGGRMIPQFGEMNAKLSLDDNKLYITDIMPLVGIFTLAVK